MSSAPTVIHRYKIVDRIGQGGMGALYLAHDPLLDRLVALKVLRDGFDNDELRERFIREARSAARLAHINIVSVFDFGEHEGRPFLAMEYIPGETLSEVVRRKAPLALGERLRYIEDLCAGLGHAHKASIVHRDVKPANVMISPDGVLKVLDFGIARIADSRMTQTGVLVGTLNYMSPEQVTGAGIDQRSDIFAVGAVFYELLAYKQAFPGGLGEGVLHRILHAAPEPIERLCPGIDPAIVAVVSRALEKEPDRRYQQLTVMQRDLAAIRERLERTPGLDTPTVRLEPDVREADTPRPAPDSGGSGGVAGRVPTPYGRRGTDPQAIEQRRAAEIALRLDAAAAALEQHDHPAAIAAAEAVLLLSQDHPQAIAIIDRAQEAQDAAALADALLAARDAIAAGDLDRAASLLERAGEIDPRHPDVTSVRSELDAARQRMEDRRLREAASRAALARAERNLAEGAFESAIRAAAEALALSPGLAAAETIRQRASEHLEADQRREREAREAREAAAEAQRLAALVAAQTAEAERARLAAETLRREHEVAALIADAERAVQARDIAGADRALDAAAALAPGHERLAPLRTAIGDIRHQERLVDEALRDAQRAVAGEQFDEARAAIDRVADVVPEDPRIGSARQALDAQEAEVQRVREESAHRSAADAAVSNARQAFDGGRHEDALALLDAFGPSHDLVTAARVELRQRLEALERARVEEEEKRRRAEELARLEREAEQRAAEARERRVRSLLQEAESALREHRAREALAAVAQLRQIDATIPTGAIESRAAALIEAENRARLERKRAVREARIAAVKNLFRRRGVQVAAAGVVLAGAVTILVVSRPEPQPVTPPAVVNPQPPVTEPDGEPVTPSPERGAASTDPVETKGLPDDTVGSPTPSIDLTRARRLYGQGNRVEALNALLSADARASDAASRALLSAWITDATSAVNAAAERAVRSGVPTSAPEYRQAAAQRTAADELVRQGRGSQALPAYWRTEESFAALKPAPPATPAATEATPAATVTGTPKTTESPSARPEPPVTPPVATPEKTPAPAASAPSADQTAILAVITAFQRAMNEGDRKAAEQAKQLTAQERSFFQTFARMRSFSYRLTPTEAPRVAGNQATVACAREQTLVDQTGRGLNTPGTVVIRLERRGAGWLITDIR